MEASKALTGEVGFKSDLLKNQKYIENLLPHHVRIDRFINSAAIAWVKSDRLQKCTRLSLMEAVYTAAQLGLDFIEVKGHAYLIPFGTEAKFIPGFRGLIELAKRSPEVSDIQARIVYEKELPNFRVQYGSDPRIDHIPTITGERGAIIGAYSIGFYANGKSIPEWMDMEQLEKVRNVSQNKAGEIWKKWPEEMYRKAPVRRLCKYLPSNPDLELAIEKDNELYDLNEIEEPERPKITAGEATEKAKENLRREREAANGKAPDESHQKEDNSETPSLSMVQVDQIQAWMRQMNIDLMKVAVLTGLTSIPTLMNELPVETYDKLKIIHGEWERSKAKRK